MVTIFDAPNTVRPQYRSVPELRTDSHELGLLQREVAAAMAVYEWARPIGRESHESEACFLPAIIEFLG